MDACSAGIVALDLADALEHAHGLNAVHRDIKPSNVFRTATGRITLIDFGLGAFVEGDLVARGDRAASCSPFGEPRHRGRSAVLGRHDCRKR